MILSSLKEELNFALHEAVRELCSGRLDEAAIPMDRCVFGPTKAPEHGDLATSAAMVLAKPLGQQPVEIAEQLAAKLTAGRFVASAEVARPGFVNLRLAQGAFTHVLRMIDEQKESYGDSTVGNGASVLLEFVSANPTGPMHIGHCRHAASGDAIARILRAANYKVTTEFYINDAGAQVQALGRSFRLRCLEAIGAVAPGDIEEKADEKGVMRTYFEGELIQYSGEYLQVFARDFVQGKDPAAVKAMSPDEFAWEARNRNLEMIKSDLAAMGVEFDSYVSEKALHDKGAVDAALDKIRTSGRTYEKDGALWLGTQEFGDNEDRVMVKGDGSLTYLVPDVAYHDYKYGRGFDRYINVFGADHGGYPPRLRAGIAALGHDETKLSVLFLRLVFLTRAGGRVKFSKRAGNFVAMADVVEDAGADATRWFMLQRSMDSEFEFDMDLAQQHTSVNPVFKVQYAHARICSLERKAAEQGLTPATDLDAAAAVLAPIERDMILYLAQFPEVVERSAQELAVHNVPSYLLGLADLWNRYWSMAKTDPAFRILQNDNKQIISARLLLADAIRRVIANGLALMGINAPVRMVREEEEEA